MLKTLKRICLQVSAGCGLTTVVGNSHWRQQRLLIICYHGIARDDEHLWRPALYIPPGLFRARMEAIRKGGYRVLSLGESLTRLQQRTLPPKSVVLTFDDGEVGFYTHAHPILEEYGFPVTVYLPTYYVEKRLPVVTVFLSYVLWRGRGRSINVELPELGRVEVDTTDETARTATWSTLMRRMEVDDLDSDVKNRVIRHIADALDVDYDRLRADRRLELMVPSEVRELAQYGVDFQLHTHRHRVPDERDKLYEELSENRDVIRRITGQAAKHLCYPSGVYNDRVIAWLRQEDIRSAVTCDPGMARPDADPLMLPRLVDVPTLAPVEFEAWLSGIADWLPKRRQRAP